MSQLYIEEVRMVTIKGNEDVGIFMADDYMSLFIHQDEKYIPGNFTASELVQYLLNRVTDAYVEFFDSYVLDAFNIHHTISINGETYDSEELLP